MSHGDGLYRYALKLYAALKYCLVASSAHCMASLRAVPLYKCNPKLLIPLVVIKCRHRPNTTYF